MNWKDLDAYAQKAAQAAASLQRHYYTQGVSVRHKGVVDLVTQADLDSQKAILEVLQAAFPSHTFMAEENSQGHTQDFEGPLWVIDPLDGTTNFAHRYPYFGISIAYVEKGQVLYGLIYQPLLNECFVAARGHGAFLNGERLAVSQTRDVSQAFLATGFPYDKRESPHNNLGLFAELELASLCVRRGGAAAIDLAYTAAGRFDGFWEAKLKPWDMAAGIVLIEEAGGRISDYSGRPLPSLHSLEIVASNGHIHDDLVAHTRTHALTST